MEQAQKFFTYGLLTYPGLLETLTGRENIQRTPATLEDFGLFVQRLDQVPNVPLEGLPDNLAPQKILKENWPDDFESYMIKPKVGSSVRGNVVELTLDEVAFISEWELEDLGWFGRLKGVAITDDGQRIQVNTDGWRKGQEVDRQVDGHNYGPLLPKQNIEDFKRVAEKARREFEEKRFSKEGSQKLKAELK